jgi:hypothetical protein
MNIIVPFTTGVRKTVALFDIADAAFTFYTTEEWDKQVAEWRQDLIEHGMDDYIDKGVADLCIDEIVELIGGEEYSWSIIE